MAVPRGVPPGVDGSELLAADGALALGAGHARRRDRRVVPQQRTIAGRRLPAQQRLRRVSNGVDGRLEAMRAVYASTLEPGARRADFVRAGLLK
jgi:hypothetical protein